MTARSLLILRAFILRRRVVTLLAFSACLTGFQNADVFNRKTSMGAAFKTHDDPLRQKFLRDDLPRAVGRFDDRF